MNLVSDKNIYITYPRGQYDNLRASVEVKKPLIAPVEKGQKIGELIVKNGTQTILNTPLYAQETVEQASFMKRYWDQFKYKFQNKFQKLKAQIM